MEESELIQSLRKKVEELEKLVLEKSAPTTDEVKAQFDAISKAAAPGMEAMQKQAEQLKKIATAWTSFAIDKKGKTQINGKEQMVCLLKNGCVMFVFSQEEGNEYFETINNK